MFATVQKYLDRWFAKDQPTAGWPERTIKVDVDGFTVVSPTDPEPTRCDWSRVREVFAYKIDLFAYDEICLGFRFNGEGHHWWVGESYTGYQALVDALPRHFPGIRTDWFSEVAVPAFATNHTTLWGEPMPPADLPKLPKRRWLPW